jgi:glutathione S-transferase
MQIAGTSLKPLELWRSDVKLDDARNFASAIAAAALRAGAGARVTFARSSPQTPLVLYERESCPYSRLVRETLSELDLDAVIKPCPHGEGPHNRELREASGANIVPFLVDRSQHVSFEGGDNIVRHLAKQYGAHAAPQRLRASRINLLTSSWASRLRGGEPVYREPKRRPDAPLELFNYEASPYCRVVRETLDGLGIAYLSRNMARDSIKRSEFKKRFGREQFPYLFDPNTGVGMFESDAIVRYLNATYATCFDAVPIDVGCHPA